MLIWNEVSLQSCCNQVLFCRPSAFTVYAGRAYVLKIVPTVHKYSEHFRTLTLDERKCQLNDEHAENLDSMFKYYTQKTCIYECTLRNVLSNVVSTNLCILTHERLKKEGW